MIIHNEDLIQSVVFDLALYISRSTLKKADRPGFLTKYNQYKLYIRTILQTTL